ncbi:hypothetical protein E2C01_067346 [Portunus trituberculatus]|uniref:Uncharacterized protein n=1 Tax=Portunus trituberculatus TaxID=210409 RepID=A0A5B7HKR1_PORTR|nr:hypothetical protein [Portunus trituberculatus]
MEEADVTLGAPPSPRRRPLRRHLSGDSSTASRLPRRVITPVVGCSRGVGRSSLYGVPAFLLAPCCGYRDTRRHPAMARCGGRGAELMGRLRWRAGGLLEGSVPGSGRGRDPAEQRASEHV